jgi:hypothetical protein
MFYRVLDNNGYVKVNFISDDAIAMEMNETSRHLGSPSVSSPAFMGGYTYPILADLAQGATFQILKAPVPRDGNPKHVQMIRNLAVQRETVYSYVDSGDVTIVQIEGWDHAATPLASFGWNVVASGKTFKRLKTLNRPFRLWNKMDRPLRIALVDDDSYTNEDLSGFDEAEIERLLDGAFVISRELFEGCLANVQFPEVTEDDMRPELMVNYYRSQEYLRQAQFFHAFNARIFGPRHFVGLDHDDELWQKPGMLKGEAFINVSDMCERMGVDVICTRSALKFEVSNNRDTFVLMEPQKAKTSGVNSDLQTMINLPALYQHTDVQSWTREFLLAHFERLKNDEVMEAWYDMSTPFFNASSRFFDQNDVVNLTKWNARAWLMSGRRITESPWLFEQLGYAIAKTLRSNDASKLRFPVPCAVRAQVISQSFASMAGEDLVIEVGQARWSQSLESIVVNDLDWLEMYRSHGGHDLDDFFVGYWRTIDGERKIIVVRSPNDWGEYTKFDYVVDDWFPSFTTHTGEVIAFPEVSGDENFWPTRLSEMVANEQIIYTGLPSENNPGPKVDPHPYGIADVMYLVENNRASASCVGANVNARSLWSLCTRTHRQVQLTSMESCIDTGTQGGSSEDAEAVLAEAKDMVEKLVRNPEVLIDDYMWYTRFYQIFGMPFDRSRLSNTSHISRAHRFRVEATKSFIAMVREHAQHKLARNVDPQVHRLGKRFLRPGYETLQDTRLAMVQMQAPGEQSLVPGDWGDVHAQVLDKINSYEKISDRHDFVMGLYSACFKAPTASTGKVTDQLVMNPHVFPYLLESMRFYGLAYYITTTPDGRLERWKHESWDLKCNSCGAETQTTDPIVVQSYHLHDGICGTCRSQQSQ